MRGRNLFVVMGILRPQVQIKLKSTFFYFKQFRNFPEPVKTTFLRNSSFSHVLNLNVGSRLCRPDYSLII
jgi:hypothetical protein